MKAMFRPGSLLYSLFAWVVILIVAFPLIWMILTSLKPQTELFMIPLGLGAPLCWLLFIGPYAHLALSLRRTIQDAGRRHKTTELLTSWGLAAIPFINAGAALERFRHAPELGDQ